MKSLPSVSIIIPCLNEEYFIDDCVNSLLQGSLPLEQMEILVIDGGSSDLTREKVTVIGKTYPQVKLLNNPKKIVPAAMNIGLNEARYPLIIWCGAHAIYDRDYVTNSIKVLKETGGASVGGVISPIAKTHTGKSIATATSSKFGIGNAHYRYATNRMSVDTVFGGCFLKNDVIKIGGFNENWVRNQDYEFNYRLRTQIGEVILDPSIQCEYYCRESIPQLAKQYFQYGFWRFNTLLKHPHSFTLRQAAPVCLILGLLGSFVLLLLGNPVGCLMPLIYTGTTLAVSAYIAVSRRQLFLITSLPKIFFTIHLAWGAGFIKSMGKTVYTLITKTH